MELVVTNGCAKLQSSQHHQQTNTQFVTGWMPFLSGSQQKQSAEVTTALAEEILLLLPWLLLPAYHFTATPGRIACSKVSFAAAQLYVG